MNNRNYLAALKRLQTAKPNEQSNWSGKVG